MTIKGFLIVGKVIDLQTGQKLHETKTNSLKSFDELFTKAVRRKLE